MDSQRSPADTRVYGQIAESGPQSINQIKTQGFIIKPSSITNVNAFIEQKQNWKIYDPKLIGMGNIGVANKNLRALSLRQTNARQIY